MSARVCVRARESERACVSTCLATACAFEVLQPNGGPQNLDRVKREFPETIRAVRSVQCQTSTPNAKGKGATRSRFGLEGSTTKCPHAKNSTLTRQ